MYKIAKIEKVVIGKNIVKKILKIKIYKSIQLAQLYW